MQRSFSDLEYAAKKKVTRRDRFLAEIERLTPWAALEAALEPFYPNGGGRGHPPIGLVRMLRMYIAQQCFGLSDKGIEDAVYDSQAIWGFVGIDLSCEEAPDATTLLKFRRLLERHGLTRTIFETINAHLAEQGLMLREGTIVDAPLVAASVLKLRHEWAQGGSKSPMRSKKRPPNAQFAPDGHQGAPTTQIKGLGRKPNPFVFRQRIMSFLVRANWSLARKMADAVPDVLNNARRPLTRNNEAAAPPRP